MNNYEKKKTNTCLTSARRCCLDSYVSESPPETKENTAPCALAIISGSHDPAAYSFCFICVGAPGCLTTW